MVFYTNEHIIKLLVFYLVHVGSSTVDKSVCWINVNAEMCVALKACKQARIISVLFKSVKKKERIFFFLMQVEFLFSKYI